MKTDFTVLADSETIAIQRLIDEPMAGDLNLPDEPGWIYLSSISNSARKVYQYSSKEYAYAAAWNFHSNSNLNCLEELIRRNKDYIFLLRIDSKIESHSKDSFKVLVDGGLAFGSDYSGALAGSRNGNSCVVTAIAIRANKSSLAKLARSKWLLAQ